MNIINKDGKHYLETFIAKVDNNHIDTTPFFYDVESAKEEVLKNFNKKYNMHYTYLNENQYGYNLQAILNRFSGNYFSPSFLKSYSENPASCFYSMLCEDETGSAASIGTTFHSIMEMFYRSDDRSLENLEKISSEMILDNQEDKIKEYLNGYIHTPDYITGKPMEDIDCECEYRGRSPIYIPRFNKTLPTCSFVIDRIDFRGEDIYIVDYKTGSVTNKNLTFDGNLAQMIIYKWAVEQKFDKEVKDVYICAPGNKKYMLCNCDEENQKNLISDIEQFFNRFKEDNSRRVYEYTDRGYFTNKQMMEFREIMNDNSIRMAKIPVEVYVGEEREI